MIKALRIKDFPNYYVTNTGDVYSRASNKYNNQNGRIKKLRPQKSPTGYLHISLCKDGLVYNGRINRLVAEAFISNPENKQQVNHIDGDKTNNCVENLEWVTQSENMKHAYNIIKTAHSPRYWANKFGKDNPHSKIVLQIKNGKLISKFYGAAEAHRKTGISRPHIVDCCNGKRKTAGGYQWRYVERKGGQNAEKAETDEN